MLVPVTVASKLPQVDDPLCQERPAKAPSSARTFRSSERVRSEALGLVPRSVTESVPRAVAACAVATVKVAVVDPPAGTLTLTGAAVAPNGRLDALRLTVPEKLAWLDT